MNYLLTKIIILQ
ncbi:BH3862 [Halalkalibacterium halodurans C-125]|uniref:BH3862 protein n=1 Tax=Halalkalibacterium halodurans (strain ATCC BAA-125 / DSM 18197 / FERM 7344 / JCM 9153 / C-125) TaxID=272558 RepID=Q9K670_HALH5|nr:BH3862 [Halalkalibacterium halodurans C-125]